MSLVKRKPQHRASEIIESLLLTCIVNMNVLRFIFNIYSTSIILYVIYALFLIIGFANHKRKINIKITPIFVLVALLVSATILTALFNTEFSAMNSAIKFFISILVAYMAFFMSNKQILATVKLIIAFNFIYCILILLNFDGALLYMSSGGDDTNYLTMTLTIGLMATISLAYVIYTLFHRIQFKKVLLGLLSAVIAFFTLLKFPARGSIVLPILAILIVYLLLSINNKRKFIINTVILLIIVLFALQIYSSFADPYLVQRMKSLFSNISDEERIIVWSRYWKVIKDNGLFLFGGGTNSAVKFTDYYPHNIYLQLIGEFGILGTVIGLLATIKIARSIIVCNNRLKTGVDKETFFLILGAFLYYFLTFMKSFTLYDTCPLLIFMAFLFHFEEQLKRQIKIKSKKYLSKSSLNKKVLING